MNSPKPRMFLTSYQKSGTHQIMPALRIGPDVIEFSKNDMLDLPPRYGRWYGRELNTQAVAVTCDTLRAYEGKAFGHISYLPEYADALQAVPTKVLFNVRDPRDVIVAEFHSIQKGGWPNLFVPLYQKEISLLDDPISELIELAAARWPHWLGWLDHDWVMEVKYEDLRLDSEATVRKIIEFVYPYRFDFNSTLQGLNPRPKNPTFRKGIPGEWRETFTAEHKERASNMLGEIITRLGYEV